MLYPRINEDLAFSTHRAFVPDMANFTIQMYNFSAQNLLPLATVPTGIGED